MKETNYRPTGELAGQNVGALPDKGTGTGWVGMKDSTLGASTDGEATNSLGKVRGTQSDPMDQCHSCDANA